MQAACVRLASIWLAFAQMGIASTLLYHWRNSPAERDRLLSNAAFCVLVMGSLPLLLFLWPRIPVLLIGGEVSPFLLLLAFLPLPMTAFYGVLIVTLKFAQRAKTLLAVHTVVETFRVGVTIMFYAWGSLTVRRYLEISIACVAASVLALGIIVYSRVGFSRGLSFKSALRLIRYGLVQNISVVFSTALSALPILVAVRLLSMDDTGLLATGMGIYGMAWLAADAFRSATQMKLAHTSDRAAAPACLGFAVFSFFPFFGASLALVLTGRFLIVALYGSKFAPAYVLMLAILPAMICHGMLSPIAEYLVALGRFKTMALTSGVAVILGTVFIVVGGYYYGPMGCAVGFSAATLARLLLLGAAFAYWASLSPWQLAGMIFAAIKRLPMQAMSRINVAWNWRRT